MRMTLRALLALTVASLSALVARADDWSLRIATWNVENLGDSKAGIDPLSDREDLLDKYAEIISQFDIVVLEEIWDGGRSVTEAIRATGPTPLSARRLTRNNLMSNFDCNLLSAASGRSGPRERYAVCYCLGRGDGSRLVMLKTDYATQAQTYLAANGSQQPAQQVWMRPPLFVTFIYTPPPGRGAAYTFSLYVMHTKPKFEKRLADRPAGIPPATSRTSSVYYELQGMERNLLPGPTDFAVLGDLNADCTFYPAIRRGQNFPPPPGPYAWLIDYGTRTNVEADRSCAYDRVIFNPALKDKHLVRTPAPSPVYKTGIAYYDRPREPAIRYPLQALPQDQKRLSNHYLVWFEIGERPAPPPQQPPRLVVATASLLGLSNPSAAPPTTRVKRPGGDLNVGGKVPRLDQPTGTSQKVYIVNYDATHYMRGNARIPLTDVRGAPTPVTVNSDGTLATNVVWQSPDTPGAYTIVFDANGDGTFDRLAGDFATYDNEIDFLVEGGTVPHSSVVTVDDRGLAREVFNAAIAHRVYVRARGLAPSAQVDAYVVSKKRMVIVETFTTWDALRDRGTLHLAEVSVPVNIARDPVMVSDLTVADKIRTFKADAAGNLFASLWDTPADLVTARVLTSQPPPPDNWPQGDETDRDPCADVAEEGASEDLKRACNAGNSFYDYYGDEFSVVIDANRDGVLNAGDSFDSHDIGDLTSYFASHLVLDSQSTDSAAIGEYKEYLTTKLSLSPPLDDSILEPPGRYGWRTKWASTRYLCSPDLTLDKFNAVVKPGAQIGFRVLNHETYATYHNLPSGVYNFIDGQVDIQSSEQSASVCITARNLELRCPDPSASSPVMVNAELDIQVAENATVSGRCASGTSMAGTYTIKPDTHLTKGSRFFTTHDEL